MRRVPGLQPHLARRCRSPASRPARPAACISSANSRSGARKSLLKSEVSGLTAATRPMRRKSWPLATICVPTRMSTSPAWTAPSFASSAPFLRVLSASMRAIRASGSSAASCSSSRSVPRPTGAMSGLPQSGQARGTGFGEAAVVAAQRPVLLVEDAPGAAVRAAAQPAAFAALQHRRVAAPVEEDQALLAARDPLAAAPRRSAAPAPATARRAQADGRPCGSRPMSTSADRRPGRAADPLGQGEAPIAAGFRRAASSRATASPSRAGPARLRAGRARRPGRAPSSARLPAACTTASCSSSTTIRPSRGSGANTARRVPRTRSARPSCAASQLRRRCAGVRPLCRATMRRPAKRRVKRSISCGVRLISGTSTSAWRPARERARRRRAGRPRSCRCR